MGDRRRTTPKAIAPSTQAPDEFQEDLRPKFLYQFSWEISQNEKMVLLKIMNQGYFGYCWSIVYNRMIGGHLYFHNKVSLLLELSAKHLFADIDEKFPNGFLKTYSGLKMFLKDEGLVREQDCKCIAGKDEGCVSSVACDKIKGFDIDFSKLRCVFNYQPLDLDDADEFGGPETTREFMDRMARGSLEGYNKTRTTEYEYVKVVKVNYHLAAGLMFYITFEGKLPSDDDSKEFQARVCYCNGFADYISCDLKPEKNVHSTEAPEKEDPKKPRLTQEPSSNV